MDTFSKSDPVCVMDEWRPVYRGFGVGQQQMQWMEVARTEVIDNCLDPAWNRKLQLDYFFEREQKLRFRVYVFAFCFVIVYEKFNAILLFFSEEFTKMQLEIVGYFLMS
jgi:hypothetical protein